MSIEHRDAAAKTTARRIPRRTLMMAAPALAGLIGLGQRAGAQPIHPIRTPTGLATSAPSPTNTPSPAPTSSSAPPTATATATPKPVEPDPVPVGVDSTTVSGAATYFPYTGHNVADPILTMWRRFGAEKVLSAPLSEELFDDSTAWILQYFPGIVFGYNPVDDIPSVVPMLFTSDQVAAYMPRDAAALSNVRVTGAFRDFWSRNGKEALFGQPLTNSFTGPDGAPRQVFETAILQETDQGVWLYPAWRDLVRAGGIPGNEAFTPQPPTGGTTYLVSASDGLNLRDAPAKDGPVLTLVPDNSEFIAAPGQNGDWIAGYVNGYAGWFAKSFLTEPPQVPELSTGQWKVGIWQGAILGDTNVREQPTTKAKTIKQMSFGDPVEVSAWVQGEETYKGADLWAQIGQNQFIYGRNVGRTAPIAPTPVPQGSPAVGNWIDVNLTQQLMTAYEGTSAVRTVPMTSGMPPFQTPEGWYQIMRRVANEEMTSGSIGAEEFFDLKNVLFTQYFTERGHAIHFAWWRTKETIGRPGSHGCLNLLLDDARFFWDWADIGTTLVIHY